MFNLVLDWHMITNYACVLLALYILFESIDAIRSMAGSLHHLCHKLKYLAALAVSAWMIYYGLRFSLNVYNLMSAMTIALFIWPRTVFRFVRWLSRKIDEMDLLHD